MRKSGASRNETGASGSSGSRGGTVLSTPEVTSYGLYHQPQQSDRSATGTMTASTFSSMLSAGRGGGAAEDEEYRRHQNALLERHTSAAKDGVIEMLTDQASKLGASLERVMLAKKEVEDRVDKLQGELQEETIKREGLERHRRQHEVDAEVLVRGNGELRWELDASRRSLQELEGRSKAWLQEESDRRKSAEEALGRERSVAVEYLRGVYGEDDGLVVGNNGAVAEVLVRELHGLGETLRQRDAEYKSCAEKTAATINDLEIERQRREAAQDQLAFTQERLEATKHKARKASGQLEIVAGDNEMLRARIRATEEDNEMRSRALEERKVKAQQRKRGENRDIMSDSKAKDDRIKALEVTLMQERSRLEGELQSARSDYEDAAKEARQKAARLQRRCLELEYRVATQSKVFEESSANGETNLASSIPTSTGRRNIAQGGTGGIRGGVESRASSSSVSRGSGGLISVDSLLPWRRGSTMNPSEESTPSTATSSTANVSSSTTTASTAATAAGSNDQGGRSSRYSADRLPDPSRNNASAPAWMRADLTVDRVDVD